MEKRLQLLLDMPRYERVAQEAERSGRSVSAVIRSAIDMCYPEDDLARRAAAARKLLAMTEEPAEDDVLAGPDDPISARRAYQDEVEERLSTL